MNRFVALLRGVNVGTAWIKMPALKATFARLGCENIQTYLQSGNVVFSATGRPAALASKIRQAIHADFGHDLPVLVLTAQRLAEIVRENPFLTKATLDQSFFHATILAEPAAQALPEKLPITGDEQATLHRDVLYLYCPHGYGRTKLHNNYFERILKVPATTRNWRTMQALVELTNS